MMKENPELVEAIGAELSLEEPARQGRVNTLESGGYPPR